MPTSTSPRFEMHRLTEDEWLILDHRFDRTDARHTVACVSRIAEELVDVLWLGEVTGRRRYATVADVLEAAQHAASAPPQAASAPPPVSPSPQSAPRQAAPAPQSALPFPRLAERPS